MAIMDSTLKMAEDITTILEVAKAVWEVYNLGKKHFSSGTNKGSFEYSHYGRDDGAVATRHSLLIQHQARMACEHRNFATDASIKVLPIGIGYD